MAPVPEANKPFLGISDSHQQETADMEQIVISGMSGLFPNSKSVKDLSNILYGKENPVTAENPRWEYNHPEVPKQLGKIPEELEKFDAQFFKVHYRLGKNMDAMGRKILEQTYQAIYDAGVNPEYLSGKKVGVFVGSCFSETEKACFYVASSRTGFGIAGCSKAMFANRISYWLNLKGPSAAIDASCCSSAIALERAYLSIKSGECEAAIVGGAYICLHPQSSVHLARCVSLCMDGKTKSFDKNADGCARSEAINVLFLQKVKDANRIYADVCYVKSNFCLISDELGHPKYGPYRDHKKLAEFLQQFYKEANINPGLVDYVEAWGSAVPEADKSELEAISSVFCKNRKSPVLVGNVISNIGYTEAASCICSIIKVLLGYQNGQMAANLHCDNPRDDIEALRDGRMRIVTEHEYFDGKYVGVTNQSVTGINFHALLRGHLKPKDPLRYQSDIPYLVAVSARQEAGIYKIFDDLKSHPIDPEELGLLHNMHEKCFSGHLGRGFIILATNTETNETECIRQEANYLDGNKRPLWFVYSGMGSQWAGMGTQLMRIPLFAAAIQRCNKALESKGKDIVDIITSKEKTIFDNILNSFVGIAAIQIGLTDVLRGLGLVPDKIIGHSVGELGCAYADGCLTTEEMILSAYSRGLVSVQTPFIHGSMAAVGLGYKQVIRMCPPEIEVACHNSNASSTISGPSDVMREFVTKLTAQGIFAKEVPCSNIAYHSRYIQAAGPGLLKYLKKVIPNPKLRSERWLSTSVPQGKWDEPQAKFSSAEYHTNNLLNPVLFEETANVIPANAVLIEVAPHGLLQAILKRSVPASCVYVPLTRRGHPDNALFLLEAIGQLYTEGYYPEIRALYPKIEYPVSTGTPCLSHLVEWAHDETWSLPLVVTAHKRISAVVKFIISLHDDEHAYLKGHVIGKEMLYPFSGALVCVWDTLAMSVGATRRDLSVQFTDVHLHEQPRLMQNELLRLIVQLHKGNGYFEVINFNTKIVSGYVSTEENTTEKFQQPHTYDSEEMILQSEDVYKMFYSRDIFYSGEFKSIQSVNEVMTQAKISCNGNWVTLLDSMLQLITLRRDHGGVSKPRFIRHIYIDIKEHTKFFDAEIDEKDITLEANVIQQGTIIKCGGIALQDVRFSDYPLIGPEPVSLKALKFTPYFQFSNVKVTEALDVFFQIVAENINKTYLNIVEIQNGNDFTHKVEMQKLNDSSFGLALNFEVVDIQSITNKEIQRLKTADLVLVKNIGTSDDICRMLYGTVSQDIFLISIEISGSNSIPQALCRAVASAATPCGRIVLARWRPTPVPTASAAISIHDSSDLELLRSTRQRLRSDQRLFLLSRYPPPRGLKDMVQEWRKEPNRNKIYVAMINHKIVRDQNLEQLPNFDLVFNILDHGTWGGNFYVKTEDHTARSNQNMTLLCREIGNLETLYWEDGPIMLEPNKIGVKVHFAGLNRCDAKRALGSAPYKVEGDVDIGYGMDFSGVTDSGVRVMGLVHGGSASSRVLADPSMLWPVPAHWSLEDAATVPLPFAHALYLLVIKDTMLPGARLLVHGASGALGLAIITIALVQNREVFATVSDEKKKRFVLKMFTSLPENHIFYSRNESFTDMVLHMTEGKGCDLVICCLEGALKYEAMKCCCDGGITIDTNQLPCNENYQFGMNFLGRVRHYIPVDISSIFRTQNEEEKKRLQLLVSEGITRGYVRPLPRVTYEASEAARALRLLATSRHRGRVLLDMTGHSISASPREPANFNETISIFEDKLSSKIEIDQIKHVLNTARLAISQYGSHLLLGAGNDDTLIGKMVDVLIARGARNIFLHHRKSYVQMSNGYIHVQIRKWKKLGAKVKLSNINVSHRENLEVAVKSCSKLGPLEGVYVITNGIAVDDDNKTKIISNLDTLTRKLCPSIRFFAIVNEDSNIGQEVCIRRSFDRLPSTMLNLPKITKFGDDVTTTKGRGLSCSAVVEAMERAIRSSYPVLVAQVQRSLTQKLLDQVAYIGGIAFTEQMHEDKNLEQLGLKLNTAYAISEYLDKFYNMKISADDVPKLTIARIRNIEVMFTTNEDKFKGLHVVFSHVNPDEIVASQDLVFMPTVTHKCETTDDEFDSNETYLVLVPGLEGDRNKFYSLCERLKLPAIVLQLGYDHIHETVEKIAARLTKVFLKNINPKQKFYLLGYSFGVLIALEMAAILEDQGLVGVVFCVDASPDTFSCALDSWLMEVGATDEARLQDVVVKHMYALMSGRHSQPLQCELNETQDWHSKVEAGVRALRGRVTHSSQYARAVIETALARIEQARRYDAQRLRAHPLRSLLVVLRSSCQPASVESDLGLSRYSVRAPVVYNLSADHARALDDLRCANIVNRHLDKEILDTYEKRNLCETYLLNATRFMAETVVDDLKKIKNVKM